MEKEEHSTRVDNIDKKTETTIVLPFDSKPNQSFLHAGPANMSLVVAITDNARLMRFLEQNYVDRAPIPVKFHFQCPSGSAVAVRDLTACLQMLALNGRKIRWVLSVKCHGESPETLGQTNIVLFEHRLTLRVMLIFNAITAYVEHIESA